MKPSSPRPAVFPLPVLRLEERFEDKRPRYSPSEAVTEANRCLYCADAPCIQACPTAIDIPNFIRKIAGGQPKGAARTILSANLLGRSCAQACPVEVLCEGACVFTGWGREAIHIGRLQRFAVETTLEQPASALFQAKPSTGKKIALVGAGPASLAAAGWLALEGHHCTVFEQKALPGGLNTLGIAPYKMKAEDALAEVEWILSLGRIELKTGVALGDGHGEGFVQADALLRDFDAVFLGLGLGPDSWLSVEGEKGDGVEGATAFIERLKTEGGLSLKGVRRAAVVGGGNTALDAAHELALLGVETSLVYRRGLEQMSGYRHELDAARADGVRLLEHRTPVSVQRDASSKKVSGLEVDFAPPGAGIQREVLPVEAVLLAIGQSKSTGIARTFPGVVTDAKGRIVVDARTHRTGNPRVWSAGDCVNGGKEVVNAAAEAKVAVRDICKALGGQG